MGIGYERRRHEHVFPNIRKFNVDLNPGTVSSNSTVLINVPVPGADEGDFIERTIQNPIVAAIGDIQMDAAVTAAGVVSFRLVNPTGGGITPGLIHMHFVVKHSSIDVDVSLGTFAP